MCYPHPASSNLHTLVNSHYSNVLRTYAMQVHVGVAGSPARRNAHQTFSRARSRRGQHTLELRHLPPELGMLEKRALVIKRGHSDIASVIHVHTLVI